MGEIVHASKELPDQLRGAKGHSSTLSISTFKESVDFAPCVGNQK